MPALLTRMSSRPNAASVSRDERVGGAALAQVGGERRACAGRCGRRCASAAASGGALLACSTTSAPASASAARHRGAQPARGAGHQRHLAVETERVDRPSTAPLSGSPRAAGSPRGSARRCRRARPPRRASWRRARTCDGKCSTSPAEAMRSWPSTVKRTRPRSTIVICSCGCECTAVTTCGAKRSRHTIRRSPQIIWRSMPSAMRSTGIDAQSRCWNATSDVGVVHRVLRRPCRGPNPCAAKSGCTLTTPYWRSSSSRLAAIIQRKLMAPPGAATLGW